MRMQSEQRLRRNNTNRDKWEGMGHFMFTELRSSANRVERESPTSRRQFSVQSSPSSVKPLQISSLSRPHISKLNYLDPHVMLSLAIISTENTPLSLIHSTHDTAMCMHDSYTATRLVQRIIIIMWKRLKM